MQCTHSQYSIVQVNTICVAAENIPKSLRQYIVWFTEQKDFLTLTVALYVFRVYINTSSSLEKPFQWRSFLIRRITGKGFVNRNSTIRRTLLAPINYARSYVKISLGWDSLRVASFCIAVSIQLTLRLPWEFLLFFK